MMSIEKIDFSSFLVCLQYFTCMVEYAVSNAPSNCFIERLRAAVSVLDGPCCPALLNCIDVNVHTVVLHTHTHTHTFNDPLTAFCPGLPR